MDKFFSLFVIIFFFIPDGMFLYACNLLLYFIALTNRNDDVHIMKYHKTIIHKDFIIIRYFLLFASITFFVHMSQMGNDLVKEAFRLFSLGIGLLLFPYYVNMKNRQIVLTFSFVIFIIFLSQIAFVYNITPIVNLVDKYFPYNGEALGLSSEYILSHSTGSIQDISARYSGIYRNPNQCGRYMLLAFAAVMSTDKHINMKIVSACIVCLSALLTGSRTAFFIFIVILVFWLYNEKSINKNKKKAIVYFIIPIIIYQFVLFFSESSLRVMDFSGGVEDSFFTKVNWFWIYLINNDSLLGYFIGHGSCVNVEDYGIPMLDSEWGMVFFSYGIIGFILYGIMLYKLIRNSNKSTRLISLCFLWIISSTVLFAYRMSILIILVMSIFYWKKIEKRNIKVPHAKNGERFS